MFWWHQTISNNVIYLLDERAMTLLIEYCQLKDGMNLILVKNSVIGRSPLKASYPQTSLFLTPEGRQAGEMTL